MATKSSNSVQVSTVKEYEDVIKAGPKYVLVDLFTTWCGPCKVLKPKLEKLVENNAGNNFMLIAIDGDIEIDDEHTRLYEALFPKVEFGGFPTTIMLVDGEVKQSHTGSNFAEVIKMVKKYHNDIKV